MEQHNPEPLLSPSAVFQLPGTILPLFGEGQSFLSNLGTGASPIHLGSLFWLFLQGQSKNHSETAEFSLFAIISVKGFDSGSGSAVPPLPLRIFPAVWGTFAKDQRFLPVPLSQPVPKWPQGNSEIRFGCP